MTRFIQCILAAGAALLVSACTIKENREPCPCTLRVSFADRDRIPSRVGLVGFEDSQVFSEHVNVADHDPWWVKAVPKGMLSLAAFQGSPNLTVGHLALIRPGNQADSLYACHREVDATGETAYAEVAFGKQFATVFVDLKKTAEQLRDFQFRVESGTCGTDLLTFKPVSGDFRFDPVPAPGERVVTFRLPRQGDDRLTFSLRFREESGRSFPLGAYIARMGYNWDADELQDIYIVIDLVLETLSISVSDWEEGAVFHLIEQ